MNSFVTRVGRTVVLCLVMVLFAACQDDLGAAPRTPARSTSPRSAGSASSTEPGPASPVRLRGALAAGDPYQHVGHLLHQRGVRVWWESDLVARWLEGPASFDRAVHRLGLLAQQPGTAGIKVADEIGYHDGLGSPAQALKFLRATRSALARVAPGKPILVDAVVLELGCLPRITETLACESRARADSPAATISAVTSYLRAGLIDRLDLSTGLGAPEVYPNKDLAAAQDLAWTYVAAGPWPELTRLQSRKAMAAAGGFRGNAASVVKVYVDVPHSHGAAATDIWTWRQRYQDQTVSLFGSDPMHNPLWPVLVAERSQGIRLFTHVTPSAMPTSASGLAHECDLVSDVFSDVFVAAGTG